MRNTQDRLRVALLSHWHPELSQGGTQMASYALFQYLKRRADTSPTFVAGAEPRQLGHSGAFGAFRGRRDEILWSPPGTDHFRQMSAKPLTLYRQAIELFSRIEPDLLHAHHFVGFGLDLFRFVRSELGIPVVVTLHEYLAICHHWGQMVKTTGGQLCTSSSFSECSACFPEYSSGKFFLRKSLILENLSYVDAFIAPSAFLAERYRHWGIEADRIHVIENPLPDIHPPPEPRREAQVAGEQAATTRLAFFGQYTPLKGVEVLLDAVALLPESVREKIRLTLFGFELNVEDRLGVAPRLEALKDCVVHHGPYRNESVVQLMRSVDWVIVPSTWWENSPVVIQEARASGVPVLCSDIGGMREKVRDGVDGAHFTAASSIDLAAKMTAIASGSLVVRPGPPAEPAMLVRQIVDVYSAAISARAKPAAALARPA